MDLGQTFRRLFETKSDILQALELRRDQASEAIRGFRNASSLYISLLADDDSPANVSLDDLEGYR
jgi:hypothetical protein